MRLNDLQGREKDVAIFSTVRDGKKHGSIGFVADERRVNVGLTRARSSLIVIGNAKALKTDERWGNLVKQAMEDRSVLCASLVLHTVLHDFRSSLAACSQYLAWQLHHLCWLLHACIELNVGPAWPCTFVCQMLEQIEQRFQ